MSSFGANKTGQGWQGWYSVFRGGQKVFIRTRLSETREEALKLAQERLFSSEAGTLFSDNLEPVEVAKNANSEETFGLCDHCGNVLLKEGHILVTGQNLKMKLCTVCHVGFTKDHWALPHGE